MNRRRYRNPPIEEALCEFHFRPGPEWDLTVPGKLHLRLGSEYMGKPQEQKSIETDIQVKNGQPPSVQHRERLARVRLLTEDGKRIVSVGRDVMSVHMLRPYQGATLQEPGGWDEFRPRISAALNAYWAVARPTAVSRIGIRYINKIVIPHRSVRLEDYLRSSLPQVSGLSQQIGGFLIRVEYTYPEDVRLVLTQGLTEAPTDHVAVMLDLDVIWKGTEPVLQGDAMQKVTELRDLERIAFEALITDQARELFDAD